MKLFLQVVGAWSHAFFFLIDSVTVICRIVLIMNNWVAFGLLGVHGIFNDSTKMQSLVCQTWYAIYLVIFDSAIVDGRPKFVPFVSFPLVY